MEQLPVELIQRLLSYLDLNSLRNAALSCRFLFNAFKGAETLITSKILFQHISPSVLPEAILVNKSRSLGEPSISKGLEFAAFLDTREPAPTKWSFADAWPLVQFHEKVSYLAARFASEALEKQPRFLPAGEPDHDETCRFERAIYRFQLYCNVVGELFPITENELGKMYFDHFSTWENEQLACVYEYFVRLIAKPFNYFVEHDVAWGYMRVRYIDIHSSPYAQAILVNGIDKVYHLSRASNYDQIRALLSRGDDRHDEPFEKETFLYRALDRGPNPLIPPFLPISEMSAEDRGLVAGYSFYKDPDPGPALMWQWLYRDFEPGELVAHPQMTAHRQWAFPFWNSARLQNAGLIGDPNIGPLPCSELELEEYISTDRLNYLEDMRKHRVKIYLADGRGQYIYRDTSQVEWQVSEHQRRIRLAQPRSLEEAKEFLRSVT
ncbi:hypothetical protein F5Y07DRAFT_380696 [Xylaria sp. FL0933]|nr:hypothetical protein F5Y07DRAFT_380696 [Xylaria sp. FL0933]